MASESFPDAAGSEHRMGMLWIQGWKFPPNHQIWQQRKTQIDSLNELNTHVRTHSHAYTHTRVLDLMSLLTTFLIHLSCPDTHNTVAHTLFIWSIHIKSASFKYSYKALEAGWPASPLPPPSLFLSPGILIIPPVSPPHRVGGFSLQTKFLEVSIN